ncbi:GDSL esterase/lipase At4g18970-like [Silene latifolia]|uniref:GDSL esterase/lipase At4g18970-like n=1 Tax=Silene latifolia TaxID=37657 RepID=UPI003D786389
MWRLFGVFSIILVSILTSKVNGEPLVPCYFIFGDSLSDAGNNNDLKTMATANYLPYGIDYLINGRPTGRFTNGRTIVDVIAEHLKFEDTISPFSIAKDQHIIKGVNYASGSAGIRPETGELLGDRVSLGKQLENHETIISKLGSLMNNSVGQHLESCLYTINMGSNDYLNNYFVREHYNSSRQYKTRQFSEQLIAEYSSQITTLYKNGARKMAVFGLGKVGCTLGEIVRFRPKTLCVDSINSAVTLFNNRLETLLHSLNKKLPGSKFSFINMQAIEVGPQQGITVFDKPCCILREDFQCKESSYSSTPCSDRSTHYFWDGFHPTEAVNRVTGAAVFQALTHIL